MKTIHYFSLYEGEWVYLGSIIAFQDPERVLAEMGRMEDVMVEYTAW